MNKIVAGSAPVGLVALGNPYLLKSFPIVAGYLATYSNTPTAELAAVKALFGEIKLNPSPSPDSPTTATASRCLPVPSKLVLMVEITWLGHGSFQLRLDSGEIILLDPWFTGNPKYPAGHVLDRCDAILVTHGHGDHIADVIPTAKKFNAPVVAAHEISEWLGTKGVDNRGMGKGGTQRIAGVAVTMTHAVHSSSIEAGEGGILYGGEAAGYVLTFADGRALYFSGDTNVFSDMALIEELYKPELCILSIGDHYTMGPREAALACRLLKAKKVIGMHWGTFPLLSGSPEKLAELAPAGTEILNMEPGETIRW